MVYFLLFMNKRIRYILSIVILTLTFAGSVVWEINTPATIDDWVYKYICPADNEDDFWHCTGEEIASFSDAAESIANHYHVSNGRLANTLHILWVPTGEIPERIFGGLMIGLMALLLSLFGDTKRHITLGATILAVTMTWCVFPWYDHLQSIVFQANYVWSSVVLLLYLILLPNAGTAMLIALSVIAGVFHEGFTLPIMAYVFVLLIISKEKRRYGVALGALSIGLILNLLSGTSLRITHNTDGYFDFANYSSFLSQYIWNSVIGILALILFVIELFTGKTGRKERLLNSLPLLAAMAIALCIAVVVVDPNRVMWPFQLLSCVLILEIWGDIKFSAPRASTACGIVFILLYIPWLCQLVRYQGQIRREQSQVVQELQNCSVSNSDIVFVDSITLDDDIPYYLMNIVEQPLEDWRENFNLAFGLKLKHEFVVPVNKKYRDIPFEQWPKIPGDNNLRGCWPFAITTDSVFGYHEVTLGEPRNMSPFNRTLLKASQIKNGKENRYQIPIWGEKIIMPDGRKAIWAQVISRGRTTQGRQVLRVDSFTSAASDQGPQEGR